MNASFERAPNPVKVFSFVIPGNSSVYARRRVYKGDADPTAVQPLETGAGLQRRIDVIGRLMDRPCPVRDIKVRLRA